MGVLRAFLVRTFSCSRTNTPHGRPRMPAPHTDNQGWPSTARAAQGGRFPQVKYDPACLPGEVPHLHWSAPFSGLSAGRRSAPTSWRKGKDKKQPSSGAKFETQHSVLFQVLFDGVSAIEKVGPVPFSSPHLNAAPSGFLTAHILCLIACAYTGYLISGPSSGRTAAPAFFFCPRRLY